MCTEVSLVLAMVRQMRRISLVTLIMPLSALCTPIVPIHASNTVSDPMVPSLLQCRNNHSMFRSIWRLPSLWECLSLFSDNSITPSPLPLVVKKPIPIMLSNKIVVSSLLSAVLSYHHPWVYIPGRTEYHSSAISIGNNLITVLC